MKKIILPIVFLLLTVAAAAQKYEYNGKKYDWKLVSDTYEKQTVNMYSILREIKHSTPVDYPLTIYFNKQGEVAITAKDYSVEYQMKLSAMDTIGSRIVWYPGDYPSVSISKNRVYVRPPSSDLDYNSGSKVELAGKNLQSPNQFDEIKAWFFGQKPSKPAAKVEPVEETGEIFDVVEEWAYFPGGHAACLDWIEENLKYPPIAQEEEISGSVIVQFVVNVSGALVDVKVIKTPDPSLSKEALRLVKAMPSWRPAKIEGKPVRSRVQIPIRFRL